MPRPVFAIIAAALSIAVALAVFTTQAARKLHSAVPTPQAAGWPR